MAAAPAAMRARVSVLESAILEPDPVYPKKVKGLLVAAFSLRNAEHTIDLKLRNMDLVRGHRLPSLGRVHPQDRRTRKRTIP